MSLSIRLSLLSFALFATACTNGYDTKTPAFYDNLATDGVTVNSEAAASMISDYRRNNGLNAVELDPTLVRVAEDQSAQWRKSTNSRMIPAAADWWNE